jgi:hypothetical protein
MNKKGYSPGFAWIFGLLTLFGLGLMYITFNQVFVGHLVPQIKNYANSTAANIAPADVTTIFAGIDKYMTYFHLLPFILFFTVVIYMVVVAFRKERESEFL